LHHELTCLSARSRWLQPLAKSPVRVARTAVSRSQGPKRQVDGKGVLIPKASQGQKDELKKRRFPFNLKAQGKEVSVVVVVVVVWK